MNVKTGDFARIVAPHKRAGVLLTVGERLGDLELLGLMAPIMIGAAAARCGCAS